MKITLSIIAAVLAIGSLIALAIQSDHIATAGFPPKNASSLTISDAHTKCVVFANARGLTVRGVLGTGSMAPYIPASKAGEEPTETVVAYTAVDKAPFDTIKPGDLLIYLPAWPNPAGSYIHQAITKDKDGWIMSGYHNKTYENRVRVTADNYLGRVVKVFTAEGAP